MPILSGSALAADLRQQLAEEIREHHLSPGLAILFIGDNPASDLYIRLKEKAAHEVGIQITIQREARCDTDAAIRIISTWNQDPSIHGILVQLPLPAGLDTDAIIQAIDPAKDVDSFHPTNIADLREGRARFFSPVHLAVLTLLSKSHLALNGARTILLAKSRVFTEPLVHLLKKAGSFVETYQEKPSPSMVKQADCVISALGHTDLFSGPELNAHAVIIDISTNKTKDGHVVGDFTSASALETQSYSPVPGGVGPLTIAFLLKNVIEAAKR